MFLKILLPNEYVKNNYRSLNHNRMIGLLNKQLKMFRILFYKLIHYKHTQSWITSPNKRCIFAYFSVNLCSHFFQYLERQILVPNGSYMITYVCVYVYLCMLCVCVCVYALYVGIMCLCTHTY